MPFVSTESPEQRFWKYVQKTPTCWLWTGAKFRSGHGCFRINHKTVLAHRFSYALAYGHCPEGLILRHAICCNPACVRPDHLIPGTHKDNADDRARDGHTVINRKPKLTPEQVQEILACSAAGQRRSALGRRFGVAPQTIGKIARGLIWKSIQEAH